MLRDVTDDQLIRFHNELAARRLAKTKYLKLDDAGRRAYKAEKARERRAKLKAAQDGGRPRPTVPAIRDALADAAATVLRTDGPGADAIRAALAEAFSAPALGITVTSMAKSGRLPPKLLPADWSPMPKADVPATPVDPVTVAPVADPLDEEGFEPPAFLRRTGF